VDAVRGKTREELRALRKKFGLGEFARGGPRKEPSSRASTKASSPSPKKKRKTYIKRVRPSRKTSPGFSGFYLPGT
jgi:hypothetical protein